MIVATYIKTERACHGSQCSSCGDTRLTPSPVPAPRLASVPSASHPRPAARPHLCAHQLTAPGTQESCWRSHSKGGAHDRNLGAALPHTTTTQTLLSPPMPTSHPEQGTRREVVLGSSVAPSCRPSQHDSQGHPCSDPLPPALPISPSPLSYTQQ